MHQQIVHFIALLQVPFSLKVICDCLKAIFAKIPLSQQTHSLVEDETGGVERRNIVTFGFFFSSFA